MTAPTTIGARVGLLVVTEIVPIPDEPDRWLCSCDCGGQILVTDAELRAGVVTDCGCQPRPGGRPVSVLISDPATGETLTARQWSERTGLPDHLIRRRARLGRPVFEASHGLTFRGETYLIRQWAELLGLTPGCISTRLWKGWTTERALTTPLRAVRRRKRA